MTSRLSYCCGDRGEPVAEASRRDSRLGVVLSPSEASFLVASVLVDLGLSSNSGSWLAEVSRIGCSLPRFVKNTWHP